jgi:hypothetical protein
MMAVNGVNWFTSGFAGPYVRVVVFPDVSVCAVSSPIPSMSPASNTHDSPLTAVSLRVPLPASVRLWCRPGSAV